MVLIETYWNVKDYSNMTIRRGLLVLIETYWNVKKVEKANDIPVVGY